MSATNAPVLGDEVLLEAKADGDSLHAPVLKETCLELLAPALEREDAVCVDCTLGMGGHSEAILQAFPHVKVIGIDRDRQAIYLAGQRLAKYGERFTSVQTTYDQVFNVVTALIGPKGRVSGIIMDLGVSSWQLDEKSRGFSYAADAPLDMRMNQESGSTAAELLATADQAEITRIMRLYGEEKNAARLAKAIVQARQTELLTTTGQLVDLIRSSLPQAAMRTGGHPAKRVFQALRIAVNEEITILERALPAALSALEVGGRILVESYQSLEDRIVKHCFQQESTSLAPADLPVIPEECQPQLKVLTRGAIKADASECERNKRSASVRLRAAERVRPVQIPAAVLEIEPNFQIDSSIAFVKPSKSIGRLSA